MDRRNFIKKGLAAGILYALSSFGGSDNFAQPAVNQVSPAQTEKKEERVIIKYAGEKKVKSVQDPAEIRISKRGELEKSVEKKGGRDSLERATGYKLMLPLDSFQDYLLGRFHNEGSQGDLWIYGEKPVRLTSSEDVREFACIVPGEKDNFSVYWMEDSSGPALSNPDNHKQVYCESFKIKEGKPERTGRKVYVLPESMKGCDIAYDSGRKELVFYLRSDGNTGVYVVPLSELSKENPKMYQPIQTAEENTGVKK